MIDLTRWPPQWHKISIALEELNCALCPEGAGPVQGEQNTPAFLAINPNGRIPAIVDHDADDFAVFESGAIPVYLAEKTGRLMPPTSKAVPVMQWLMFQMGGVGPMMGQANVFFRYFPEKIQPAIDRYQGESKRLFRVLDGHLKTTNTWLVTTHCRHCQLGLGTHHRWSGVEVDDLPHLLQRWLALVGARGGAARPAESALHPGAAPRRQRSRRRKILGTGAQHGRNGQVPPSRSLIMRLYVAQRAPNPRRVLMFLAGKRHHQHQPGQRRSQHARTQGPRLPCQSPLAKGAGAGTRRWARAHRNPRHLHLPRGSGPLSLTWMGEGFEERAFIEMADRRVEFYLLGGIANVIRHPIRPGGIGAAAVSRSWQSRRPSSEVARWLDHVLERQPWMAGARFTIADITAFCAIEFARLMKFNPGKEGTAGAASLA